jgi:hypothetical protein
MTITGADPDKTSRYLFCLVLLAVLFLPVVKAIMRDGMVFTELLAGQGALVAFLNQGKHVYLPVGCLTHGIEFNQSAKVKSGFGSAKMHQAEGIRYHSVRFGH